jgi:hypothetical protein
VKLITHPHVVPNLRMSGANPLLPIYHFTAYTGATLLRKSVIYSTVKLDWCVFMCVYMYLHYYTNTQPNNGYFQSYICIPMSSGICCQYSGSILDNNWP